MTKISIVSDIHLKLRRDASFERGRFRELIQHLKNSDTDIIIFNGDLLDIARPTLEEIQELHLGLSELVAKRVYIIPGNHEAVNKNTNTYEYILLPVPTILSSCTLDIEGVTLRLCPWGDIRKLKEYPPADILISHYRSAIEGLFEEEVSTSEFINNYKLILLGDIHSRYSPIPHAFYTGCPYPVHFTKSTKDKFGYIDLVINGKEYSWEYKDLDLPKKISLDVTYRNITDLITDPRHMYRINVSGTLDELSSLKSYDNVTYVKFIIDSTTKATPVVKPDLSFIDTLSTHVGNALQISSTKIRNILNDTYKGD